jgi:hypothetical protein
LDVISSSRKRALPWVLVPGAGCIELDQTRKQMQEMMKILQRRHGPRWVRGMGGMMPGGSQCKGTSVMSAQPIKAGIYNKPRLLRELIEPV